MIEAMNGGINHITTGAVLAALFIFLGVYGIIISERIHRTIISIFGAALMVIFGVFLDFYHQTNAIASVDFNTIGLLVGMMIVVGVVKDSGLFQYVAVWSAKKVKGDAWKIMIVFAVITAIASAFLDNVTTVLLMVPMTLVICDNLRVNPLPFLFMEIIMSNIGGTATLIGDPPNILIGSATGYSFMDFLVNLAPIVIVLFFITLLFVKILYKKQVKADRENMLSIMGLNEKDSITNVKLVKQSLFVLGVVIVGFFLHGALHLEAATIAIFGAGLLLFLDKSNPEKALKEVEWTTIFFFVGLFILVGGLEHAGVIGWAAQKMVALTHSSLNITAYIVLWGGAFFSAFVDNIPFVATMIPLVEQMNTSFTNLEPIWWSLALGACLGGNGTLVGASANMVVAGIAERSGYKIRFKDFMKIGLTIMIITVAISHVYIWLRYLQ